MVVDKGEEEVLLMVVLLILTHLAQDPQQIFCHYSIFRCRLVEICIRTVCMTRMRGNKKGTIKMTKSNRMRRRKKQPVEMSIGERHVQTLSNECGRRVKMN